MRKIKTTFETATPESIVDGDIVDSGWVDEEGYEIELDEYDLEEEKTHVDLAVEFLEYKGACHPSSSHFYKGCWYRTETIQDRDYFEKGEYTTYSFHLEGFTLEEEREVYERTKAPF